MWHIHPISAFHDNYIWAIVHTVTSTCAIVDPGEADVVVDFLNKQHLSLTDILITHHHWDHTGGIKGLCEAHHVPVTGPAHETIPCLTRPVKGGEVVELSSLGGLKLRVLDIPAHTKGHIAYYGEGLLFCGDTLFAGGCGRLFEGTAEQMFDSLTKLAALPSETLVYCAHEYTKNNLEFAMTVEPSNTDLRKRLESVLELRDKGLATVPSPLSLEKATNPFLRCDIPEVRTAAEAVAGKKLSDPVEVFKILRRCKDEW